MEVQRPAVAETYQRHMGGVDRNQQLRAKYPVGRPSKKYWKYFLHYIISLCLVNGFLLLKETNTFPTVRSQYKFMDFIIDVATKLTSGFTSRKRRIAHTDQPSYPMQGHRSNKLTRSRGDCKVCCDRRLGRRKTTSFGCTKCDVHLCPGACFTAYHEIRNLQMQ